MRRISHQVMQELQSDPFMEKCCLGDFDGLCSGRIEWHHNLIYAGRQVDEVWAILPLCHFHHSMADNSQLKPILNAIMRQRAEGHDISQYNKSYALNNQR